MFLYFNVTDLIFSFWSLIVLMTAPPVVGARVGEVEVVVVDPSGRKGTVECRVEDKGNSSYRCTYKPTLEGAHTIYITFSGAQIPKSPFTVTIGQGRVKDSRVVNVKVFLCVNGL